MELEKYDKNFKSKSPLDLTDVMWIDAHEKPFEIYGLYKPNENKNYIRMPEKISSKVSDGVNWGAKSTAGGRLRFKTNSPYIALSVAQISTCHMSHMALSGSSGFDLYVDDENSHTYVSSFRPQPGSTTGFAAYINIKGTQFENKNNCYTINFPLYCDVSDLHIGIKEESTLEKGQAYKDILPIVYYGSSITQGGCASHSGTCYQNFICRDNNIDYINLGFSGCAKAEKEMAYYISSLKMSVFVFDYDHNADNAEYLDKTHLNFYKIVREKNPKLPIILISKPDVYLYEKEAEERKKIIQKTYNYALENGDKNIYFIDGSTLFSGKQADSCTVDGCHPTDLGFFRMSEVIGNVINKII